MDFKPSGFAGMDLADLQVKSRRAGMSESCICSDGNYGCPLCDVKEVIGAVNRAAEKTRQKREARQANALRQQMLTEKVILGEFRAIGSTVPRPKPTHRRPIPLDRGAGQARLPRISRKVN